MKNRKKALLALIGIISSFVVGNFALSTPVSAAAKKVARSRQSIRSHSLGQSNLATAMAP